MIHTSGDVPPQDTGKLKSAFTEGIKGLDEEEMRQELEDKFDKYFQQLCQ